MLLCLKNTVGRSTLCKSRASQEPPCRGRWHTGGNRIRLRARLFGGMHTMNKFVLAFGLVLAAIPRAWATWSVIALDAKTGQVIIASATCVRQAGFPQRQPNGARDLMDVQAVIVPGLGVAACQAGVDNTRAEPDARLQRDQEGHAAGGDHRDAEEGSRRRAAPVRHRADAQRRHHHRAQQPRRLQRHRQLAVVALLRRPGRRHLLSGAGQHAARRRGRCTARRWPSRAPPARWPIA